MTIDRAFRVSSYLTLALACACLGFAELPFLPAAPFLLLAWAAFLLLAYHLDGRWTLSSRHANLLGMVILGLTLFWVANLYSLALSGEDWNGIPWPAVLLPHAGPLLMLLLLAKLFRPKRLSDHWFLQTIGFLHVALACVLVAEPFFGVLLLAYVVSGLWCLLLMQIYDARSSVATSPEAVPAEGNMAAIKSLGSGGQATKLTWPFLGLRGAGRWALVVGILGLILFLAIPRESALLWNPATLSGSGKQRLVTGFNTEIDLRATGPVEVSDEVAFEVSVVDNRGRSKIDLSPNQRWRGSIMDAYDRGRWYARVSLELNKKLGVSPARGHRVAKSAPLTPLFTQTNAELPDLGKSQYFLTFRLDRRKSGGFFLAEPVALDFEPISANVIDALIAGSVVETLISGHPGLPIAASFNQLSMSQQAVHPYKFRSGEGLQLPGQLFYEMDGALCGLPRPKAGRFSYVQVAAPAPQGQEDVTAPRWLLYPEPSYVGYHQYPMPTLRQWSMHLLRRLVAEGHYGLKPVLLDRDQSPPSPVQDAYEDDLNNGPAPTRDLHLEALLQPVNHEAIARALSRYFSTSGEYAYSLDLRHSGKMREPTLDFLMIVKQGHCERFAGGLALVLRSLGIPTRVVNGFRGAEHQGGGHYLVRQSHAHSWVEALVPVAKKRGRKCWLTLDPTPAEEAQREESFTFSGIWNEALKRVNTLWRSFVVDFSSAEQQGALTGLWDLFAPAESGKSFGDWLASCYSGRFWSKPGFWLLTAPAGGLLLLLFRLIHLRRRRRQRGDAVPLAGFYGKLLTILKRRCRLEPEPAQTPRELGEKARQLFCNTSGWQDMGELRDLPAYIAALFYQARYGGRHLPAAVLNEAERRLEDLDRALAKRPVPLAPARLGVP